ncbi:hypothetical protein C7974DRAFT_408109 [Boeremia exigua]|uniref:uncharacterized protein n=1 Tax=Boeremia exigua TaxID=749465 RepID=UPI001E8E04B0|nr:uncharacterized protein C7974DRAFT_408109 [Boeremia exigua]KAH6644428.1 hypothetical protein C7974DRAFT_408109 [Boeremia exigua]
MYIPENVSETSSESALSTAFDSYREYTDYVRQFLSANTTTEWDEELWLGQLPIDGHTIQWYRLSSHSKNTSAGFENHGTDTDMYKSTGSKETFQEQLRTPKTSVSWQILLVQFNCEFRREFLLYDDWYRDSMLWCFDIIGLALDLPLCVWNHLKDRLQGMGTPRLDTFRVSWNDDCSALDLGLNTMVTLNTKGGVLPPTVVAFLPLNNPVRIGDPMNQRCGNPVRLNHPKWAQSIISTPSKAMTNEKATFWRPANNEPAESQYLRKMIARTGARSNSPSVTDGAFACFAALLEFHLGHPSQNIPKLDYSQDSRDKVCLRHYRWPEDPWGDTRVTDVLVPTRSLLMRLRDEVDMNIMMSEKIKEYTKDHFKTLNDYQQKTLQALVGRLRLHLVHLQLTEANLKDRLSAYASEQTTEMAERNIQESKRVILCRFSQAYLRDLRD